MASITVCVKVPAFVGGAMRRPDDDPFTIDEKGFNPDVFERVAEPKAEAKAKAGAKSEGNGGNNGASVL